MQIQRARRLGEAGLLFATEPDLAATRQLGLRPELRVPRLRVRVSAGARERSGSELPDRGGSGPAAAERGAAAARVAVPPGRAAAVDALLHRGRPRLRLRR